ncbi:MAG: hypothetical protein EA415_01000 [Sphaerobacteraceae bacterium]|nr:MAG: hypothetical protein EA415_01000 [Sphaerobacteraceae bacterium]
MNVSGFEVVSLVVYVVDDLIEAYRRLAIGRLYLEIETAALSHHTGRIRWGPQVQVKALIHEDAGHQKHGDESQPLEWRTRTMSPGVPTRLCLRIVFDRKITRLSARHLHPESFWF